MNTNILQNKIFTMESFYGGYNQNLYQYLGSHLIDTKVKKGVYFRVWAPNAKQVNVIINGRNDESTPLKKINESIWEVFISSLEKGAKYKYLITDSYGNQKTKADPFAFYSSQYPYFNSIVYDLDNFKWTDQKFVENRKTINGLDQPILIYEVHLGSWKKTLDDKYLTYKDFALHLIKYLKKMHYTHVEFLPLFEHPYIGSWGYQVTGYFSPTSRYGNPEELKYLIDKLHKNELGQNLK